MSKGLETRTIVLLIIGLIILGIVFGILFLGTGPFSDAAKFGKCRGQLIAYCQGTADLSKDWDGKPFGQYKPICSTSGGNNCYKDVACDESRVNEKAINCCNAFK